ncbi:MAG: DMT family transporter [Planctomycetota bacterium]
MWIVLAVLTGLCWGIGELFTKSVLHTGKVGPITAIAVRSTVAIPIMWLVWYFAVQRGGIEPRDWYKADTPTLLKLALGSGVVAGAIGMLCFYGALHLGQVSRVKPVAFALAPTIAVILGTLVLNEPFSVRKLAAVGLILAGIGLLTAG